MKQASGSDNVFVLDTWRIFRTRVGLEFCGSTRVPLQDCKLFQSSSFLFGRGDLWRIEEASGSADVLIFGHSADLYALAFNPVKAHVFATAAEQDRIFVWDGRRRKLLRTTSMGKEVRTAALSFLGCLFFQAADLRRETDLGL